MNAAARPAKLPVTPAGNTAFASRSTADTAAPSDALGARSNESVTEGSWPEWLTVTGPTPVRKLATALSGTTGPALERTQRVEREGTSCWNCGRSSSTTQYSFVG